MNVKVAGKSTIIPNEKAHLITQAFLEIAKNYTRISLIYSSLVKDGLINADGKALAMSHFYNLLKNEIYAGWIIKFKERHKGLYQPLVSEEVFAQVQRIIRGKYRSSKYYISNNPDFPLRKFIRHPSGIRLTGCWAKGRAKRYPYYFFRIKGGNYKRSHVENIFADFFNEYRFSPTKIIKLKRFLAIKFNSKVDEEQNISAINHLQIAELKKKQAFLLNKSMEGVIADHLLKEQLEELDMQILKLTSLNISQQYSPQVNFADLLNEVAVFLKKPGEIWRKASYKVKVDLQRFCFPTGVIFDGENCRTEEVCNVFNMEVGFFTSHSSSVPTKFKKSNTLESDNFTASPNKPCIDEPFWKKFTDDLLQLQKLLNQNDEKASLSGRIEIHEKLS
jgi:site-specific DNA recombinase